MTTRTKFLLTLVAALTLTTGLVWAQPDGGRDHGPGVDDACGPRMMKALDLTEAQAEQIEAFRQDNRTELRGKHKDLMRLQHELRGLMLEDDVDESKVLGLTRKVGEMRTELQVARTAMRLKVREVLTEEQRDKMMMMKHRRGGRGKGDGAGPRPEGDWEGRGRKPHGGRRI